MNKTSILFKNISYFNKYLLMTFSILIVFTSGLTSYAFFTSELVGDNFINIKIKEMFTPDNCFAVTGTTTLTITDYKCYSGNTYGLPVFTKVIIPNQINGKNITAIADYNASTSLVFQSKGLTSVVLPNTLITIGSYAFTYNNLSNIVFPNSVTTIKDAAFHANKFTSVTFPSSVKTIGVSAFHGNLITSINFPSTVTSIGRSVVSNNLLPDNQAFIYKRNSNGSDDTTTLISYGGAKRADVVIPNTIKVIDTYAMYDNNLISVTIPSSVITIGGGAFYRNQLINVTIPSSVTTVGISSFRKNSSSNPGLIKIINRTGRSFDWGLSINGETGYNFPTGTLDNSNGNVAITSS